MICHIFSHLRRACTVRFRVCSTAPSRRRLQFATVRCIVFGSASGDRADDFWIATVDWSSRSGWDGSDNFSIKKIRRMSRSGLCSLGCLGCCNGLLMASISGRMWTTRRQFWSRWQSGNVEPCLVVKGAPCLVQKRIPHTRQQTLPHNVRCHLVRRAVTCFMNGLSNVKNETEKKYSASIVKGYCAGTRGKHRRSLCVGRRVKRGHVSLCRYGRHFLRLHRASSLLVGCCWLLAHWSG